MLIRTIAYMIVSILLITVIRAAIGTILRFLAGAASPSGSAGRNASASGGRARPVPTSEPLKKDPVCGTFVAPSTAVQVSKGGEVYYFCSADCRDKFAT